MLKPDILLSLGEGESWTHKQAQVNSAIPGQKGHRYSTHATPHPVQTSLEPCIQVLVHTPPVMGRPLPPKVGKYIFRWFSLLQILPLKMGLPMTSWPCIVLWGTNLLGT